MASEMTHQHILFIGPTHAAFYPLKWSMSLLKYFKGRKLSVSFTHTSFIVGSATVKYKNYHKISLHHLKDLHYR